ncbi:MAG: hypothetical protein JSR46_05290 [Verrucomicrobia bacterium]|nr:hypothetical protein [Verrucomicrobiota bacterium]
MRVLMILLLFQTALFATHNEKPRVLICGVCRNISAAADNTIRNIEELGSRFEEYAVVIYENNSSDDTAATLGLWASQNPRVQFLSETLPAQKMARARTVRIAKARNHVLREVKKKKYRKFPYLIMVDLDFQSSWPIDEIVDSIHQPFPWDCISANGVTPKGLYYDRYAYRSKRFPFGPELLNYEFWHELSSTGFALEPAPWQRVFSAFGGLAIYKTDAIKKFSYSGVVTKDLQKYYKQIALSLPKGHMHLKKYLKITGKRAGQKLEFRKNCLEWQRKSDNSITVCEHVALHASMALKGHGIFYINPKLVMQY